METHIEDRKNPVIIAGDIVRRINAAHGRMAIGDTSRVKSIIGSCAQLEKDANEDYEHDIKNLEFVVRPTYDSTADTLLHIKRVSELLTEACTELIQRANCHDDSKLKSPEKEIFDKWTPILKNIVYDSEEYKESLAKVDPALQHHYANNSHHPQHYPNGIDGMNLFDLIEMFFDWKASSERNKAGNIVTSIEKNQERFNMSPQLAQILKNTVTYLGY